MGLATLIYPGEGGLCAGKEEDVTCDWQLVKKPFTLAPSLRLPVAPSWPHRRCALSISISSFVRQAFAPTNNNFSLESYRTYCAMD